VALIGDLTDGTVERNRGAAVVLKSIKARIGKYFVTGMPWLYLFLSVFCLLVFCHAYCAGVTSLSLAVSWDVQTNRG